MSYAMYLRKSRADLDAEARGEGETLARHRSALTDLAVRRGLCIGEAYEEIVSGDTIADRPQMQRLLRDVQAGRWDGVLVMEVERLARGDSIDQGIVAQTFKYSGTLIVTPIKTYDPADDADEEFFEFSLFMARREYKTIKRRLQAGRVASVKEGKYMGTRDPYGYRRVKLRGEKGWSLEVIPEQAELVRMAYRLYLRGEGGRPMGCNRIADRFNALGAQTWSGVPWTRDQIRGMLLNPVYVGCVQWAQRETVVTMTDGKRTKKRPVSDNHIVVPGRHAAIVDQADWDAVQQILRAHVKPPTTAAVVNPLRGLVRCSECGRVMQMTWSEYVSRQRGRQRVYYLRCMTPHCKTARIDITIVESGILTTLESWVIEAERTPACAPVTPDHTAELDAIDRQRATLLGQLDRARDLLEQAIYDTTTYLQRQQQLKERIAALDAERDRLIADARPHPTEGDAIRALLPQIKTVLASYRTAADAAQKNDLLRTVVDHILYHRTERTTSARASAETMTLEVFPRLIA